MDWWLWELFCTHFKKHCPFFASRDKAILLIKLKELLRYSQCVVHTHSSRTRKRTCDRLSFPVDMRSSSLPGVPTTMSIYKYIKKAGMGEGEQKMNIYVYGFHLSIMVNIIHRQHMSLTPCSRAASCSLAATPPITSSSLQQQIDKWTVVYNQHL